MGTSYAPLVMELLIVGILVGVMGTNLWNRVMHRALPLERERPQLEDPGTRRR